MIALFLSGCLGQSAEPSKPNFEQLAGAVADNGAKFYDVRRLEEFQDQNFGITENLPLAELEAGHLPDLPKDTLIYVHCQSGRRSAQAVNILKDAGFTQVVDLGGLEEVKALGGILKK